MTSMKRKIFVAASVLAAVISCERNEGPQPVNADAEKAMLEVRMVADATKVSGEGGAEENAVSDYQVLVYDMTSRSLEAYEKPGPEAVDVRFQCRVGIKEVVVLANAPDMSDMISYDDFLKEKSFLSDNSVGQLVMEGHAPMDLTASGASVTVDLRRMVSKVILDGITVDFEHDGYDDLDFVLKKIYLTNVAGDMTYSAETADPAIWYNKIVQTSSDDVDGLILETLSDVSLKGATDYTSSHHFYCYPNPYKNDDFSSMWSPRPTRLVVEAELGGETFYYPVSLPVLERNNRYHVSLHIVRPGARTPEQDMDRQAASFTINIVGWQGSSSVTETI